MTRGPLLAVAAVALLLIAILATIGAPSQRPAPAPATTPAAPPPPSISAGGVTLASSEITLPDDAAAYPPGPHQDAMQANCSACHSPSMVLTQPRLSADQWQAEVTKMREVYKAPVPDAAVPAILAYLTALPPQQGPGPAAARAQDPDPRAAPVIARPAG